jgi:hypothetical protein
MASFAAANVALLPIYLFLIQVIGIPPEARWMYEHDIIISAHGAAITHSIFVQKCTAVIQLYPEHYYPNKLFEPLIIESALLIVSMN